MNAVNLLLFMDHLFKDYPFAYISLSLFYKSSLAMLQSIAKWRYAAKIEDGKPVAVEHVQQRITFDITD